MTGEATWTKVNNRVKVLFLKRPVQHDGLRIVGHKDKRRC